MMSEMMSFSQNMDLNRNFKQFKNDERDVSKKYHQKAYKPSSKSTVIFLQLITFWSVLLSVSSYEIWSVYFDDTMPSIREISKDSSRTRRQLFEVPFSQTRHIFEIATYINETSGLAIRRMEISLCERLGEESTNSRASMLPTGATVVSPKDNLTTFSCLQRLATQQTGQDSPGTPQQSLANRTLLRYPQEVGLSLVPQAAVLLTVEYTTAEYHLLGDNSGFELYLADQPVAIEAGVLVVGQAPDHRFIIPPGVSEWTTKGTCPRSCFYNDQAMEQDDLSIVAIFPGTDHRSLEEMTLQISSPDGSKAKIFAWGGDTSVDISGQPPSFRRGAEELELMCSYGSSNQTLLGGFDDATRNNTENCLVWLHYYPKVEQPQLDGCFSSYSAATIMSLLDISELNATLTPNVGLDLNIEGQSLAEFVAEKDRSGAWDRGKLMRSKYSAANGRSVPQCGWTWAAAAAASHTPMDTDLRRRRRRRRRRR